MGFDSSFFLLYEIVPNVADCGEMLPESIAQDPIFPISERVATSGRQPGGFRCILFGKLV